MSKRVMNRALRIGREERREKTEDWEVKREEEASEMNRGVKSVTRKLGE